MLRRAAAADHVQEEEEEEEEAEELIGSPAGSARCAPHYVKLRDNDTSSRK